MSFILTLLRKIDDLFVSPHMPLDAEYSYAARRAEAERVRRSHLVPICLYRR